MGPHNPVAFLVKLKTEYYSDREDSCRWETEEGEGREVALWMQLRAEDHY